MKKLTGQYSTTKLNIVSAHYKADTNSYLIFFCSDTVQNNKNITLFLPKENKKQLKPLVKP